MEVSFSDQDSAEVAYSAILPELPTSSSSRTKTILIKRGRTLKLKVKAKDITALRAIVNAYLRWFKLIQDLYLIKKR
ncbi:MAG: KEOPS complex subunit Pcc1 [Candidatus Hodarchaeota archaeon]